MRIENYKLPELGLVNVQADGRPLLWWLYSDGFRWNLELGGITEVSAGVLHVWAWAQGELDSFTLYDGTVWMAVEYDANTAVPIHGRVEITRCRTVAVSSKPKEVVEFIKLHTPPEKQGLFFFDEKEVEEGDVAVGDGGVAITKGGGRARAGRQGRAEAGDGGHAFVSRYGTAIAGKGGEACALAEWGEAIVGDGGTARAGFCGTAKAGVRGKAEAGANGTAIVGEGGIARAGSGGKLIFGDKVFAVGWDNIQPKPNTYYKFESGKLKRTRNSRK